MVTYGFGIMSPNVKSWDRYTLTCCEKKTYLEIAIEPVINDPSTITLKCPICGEEHYLIVENSAGTIAGGMELMEVDYL